MIKVFILYFLLLKPLLAWQKIDLNKANKEQISLLPGIGKKIAEEIIAQRAKQNFSDANQLKSIKGISENKFNQIKDLVTFSSSNYIEQKSIKKKLPNPINNLVQNKIIELKDLESEVLKHLNLEYQDDKNAIDRVRHAHAAPNVTFIADFDKNIGISKKKDISKESLNNKEDIDVGFGIKIEFDFNKLIFNEDEITLANLILKKLEHRYEVLQTIHKHYFAYKNKSGDLEAHAAILDSYSNNAFSNFIKEGQR